VITTAKDVNPDARGRPSPVVVRLYYLRSSDAFQGVDFFQLYDDEGSVLGSELIGREEFSMSPESKASFERRLDDGTRYIGVAAAFQNLEDARWRTMMELPKQTETRLQIEVQRLGVVITEQ
jgi:type VI secretion system protein VasD